MTLRLSPKWLLGKRIAQVELNPFPNGRGGRAYDPRITFTDGSSIKLDVMETETEPGVRIIYFRKPQKPKGLNRPYRDGRLIP